MKIYLPILIFLLCTCSSPEEKIPKNIAPRTTFKSLLKEIHLVEAAFELNKAKGIESAKNELANAYFHIYEKHQISEDKFKETLNYYSRNPEKLECVYTDILELLTKEKSKLY